MAINPENLSWLGKSHYLTALAPMQDVTTLPFMKLINKYGAPDIFVSEFLRVHDTSKIDEDILECLANPPHKNFFVQLIGENISSLNRIAREILSLYGKNIAGIDLNLGCPAPKVYRKNVGGGLLKDLPTIEKILPELRKICDEFNAPFSVKCRLGFDDFSPFPELLNIFNKNNLNLVSVHARSVKGLYRSPVFYPAIKEATENLSCPVLANGEISSLKKALLVQKETNCAGWMIGRHAIRNPWIFRQIREHFENKIIFTPRLSDVFNYINDLILVVSQKNDSPQRIAARMKKFLIFIGTAIDEDGHFLYEIRRANTDSEILKIAEKYLLHKNAETLYPAEPFQGVIARPNCEI